MMKNKIILILLILIGSSCSYKNYYTENDQVYPIKNGTSNFQKINQISNNDLSKNFSNKNINPEYIARYQSNVNEQESIYFDDNDVNDNSDINIYNDWNNNQWGMNIYNPFLRVGFGFGSVFNIGFGFDSPFMMRHQFGFGMLGMRVFYDPFFNPFFPLFGIGFTGLYSGYGYGGYGGFSRHLFINPEGKFNNRQIVRGSRPARSSGIVQSSRLQPNTLAEPTSLRSTSRRNATSSDRFLKSNPSRNNTRSDFSSSQNDYYNRTNSRTRAERLVEPSLGNVSSSVIDRRSIRIGSQSAAPSYRNVAPNKRNTRTTPSGRNSSPSYNRSTSPSNNRTPLRGTYNTPNSRTYTPTRSTPSYSAPSRSSGGSVGGSSGGRSSSGGSRGGRGG